MVATSVPWRRTFVIFWCGQFIALTGLAFAMFSLGVYIYVLYESPTLLGVAFALPILPFVLASPVAGPLVDRWGARRALLVSNVGGILNLLVLAALHATGTFAAGRVMMFLWIAAALKALHLAAFDTAVPFLVPKRHLGRANGTRMFVTATSAVLGPVVAAPLLLAAGVYGVIVMGCLSFTLAIFSLRYVRVPEIRRDGYETAGGTALLGEFREAWRYVVSRRGLLVLFGFLGVVNVGIGASELLFTQLTLSFTSEAGLNTVLVVGALGLAVGTLAMIGWGGPRRLAPGMLGFSLLLAAAMVLGALRPSVPLLAVAAFLFLGSTPVIIGTLQTLWHLKVEPQLLGRTAALKNLFIDVPYLLANILMGFAAGLVFVPLVGEDDVRSPALATLVGNGPGRGFALLMMTVGVVIALCLLLLYRYPRLRHLEHELPDVTPSDMAAASPPPAAVADTMDRSGDTTEVAR